jgi:ectoine hydroxylase-related dioxygenase (phytanoyl-CoA dioxygenase family)
MLRRALSSTALPRPATWPEDVLQYPAKVLSDAQRREYFCNGTIVLEGFLSKELVEKLKAVANEFVEKSRHFDSAGTADFPTKGDTLAKHFVFEKGHTKEHPRLTRLTSPHDVSDTFWEFTNGPAADVAEDLLGPDVKFHHSKLNYKWAADLADGEGGQSGAIRWHQDIQFWPHTNYTPLTIGVYLNDVSADMGPMGIVPLSAYDHLHALEDVHGNWTGYLPEEALSNIPLDAAIYGSDFLPAGTVSYSPLFTDTLTLFHATRV